MKVLDLFSGIGGFSLGLERAGMTTVAFCEINPFCQKILRKHWPHVPIFDNVKTLDYEGSVDLVCGGYPCQPFSVAGKRRGQKDDRHLWPAMFDQIKKHKPYWVIGENVAGHINLGLDDVLSDLESENYSTRAFVIPACSVGAPHRRDRVWIIARYKDTKNIQSNASYDWSQRIQRSFQEAVQGIEAFSWCEDIRRIEDYFERSSIPQPLLWRNDNGVSSGVDRLRSLGNAVVPQIPEIIGLAIMKIERELRS